MDADENMRKRAEAEGLRYREGDQRLPEKNDQPYIQDLVIADIQKRRELGISRYGTALQPHNGRDALQDAYDEAIDLCQYLKQAIVERDALMQITHQACDHAWSEWEPAPGLPDTKQRNCNRCLLLEVVVS